MGFLQTRHLNPKPKFPFTQTTLTTMASMLKIPPNYLLLHHQQQKPKRAFFAGAPTSTASSPTRLSGLDARTTTCSLNWVRNRKQRLSTKMSATNNNNNVTPTMSMSAIPDQRADKSVSGNKIDVPIMVNGCSGKMGKAIIQAANSAGLSVVPVSFGSAEEAGKTIQVGENQILVHGPSERESTLASLVHKYPNLIVVDFTVPSAVNANAELYCKVGVPFVMGTTGGDRDKLYKTVQDSNVYAVISPQMGKQVVAFLAAMEIMAEQFPGAFSGYSLQVMESHQASKVDTSGTAKAVISCFQKLGVPFEMEQIQLIRDPQQQVEMVGVPEEHLAGHAFHMYHLTSPDQTVSFEFQHNVCGRSIYAEGTVDAVIFLAKKVHTKADQRIYNMMDVLREGNMR